MPLFIFYTPRSFSYIIFLLFSRFCTVALNIPYTVLPFFMKSSQILCFASLAIFLLPIFIVVLNILGLQIFLPQFLVGFLLSFHRHLNLIIHQEICLLFPFDIDAFITALDYLHKLQIFSIFYPIISIDYFISC